MTRTLKDYARHDPGCEYFKCGDCGEWWDDGMCICRPPKQTTCTCGLDALLAECAPAAPPVCICDRTAHPNDCPVHRDYQPDPETETPCHLCGAEKCPGATGGQCPKFTPSAPSPSDVEQAKARLLSEIQGYGLADRAARANYNAVYVANAIDALIAALASRPQPSVKETP